MFKISAPPPEGVLRAISYDPQTGRFMRLYGKHPGSRADLIDPKGYMRIRYEGRTYAAHRLAFYFVTGEWPSRMVDHKNRDRSDNRFENLRFADFSQNSANSSIEGRTLPKGVTRHRCGKYQASIKVRGSGRYLGLFDDPLSAHAAYLSAAQSLFGEFARAA